MATNPLTAIAKGTANTIEAGAGRVKDKIVDTIPNPAKMAYSIGLGIGPLIQNIVKEMKKDKKDSDDKVVKKLDDTKKSQERGQGKVSSELSKMTAQLSMSNALLKEIRNLQIKQITAANKQNGLGNTNRMIRESDSRIQAATSATFTSPASAAKEEGGSFGIKTLLGLGLGTMALSEIWKMLPDSMKNDIKDGAGSMVKGAADLWLSALKESPGLTLLGTYMVTKMTGLFDLAFGTARAAIATGKVISRVPEAVSNMSKAAGSFAGAEVSSGSAPGAANALRRYAGMEQKLGGKSISELAKEYKDLTKYANEAYATEVFTGRYGEKGLEAIKAATADVEAVSGLSKATGALKTVARVATPLAVGVDVGVGAYDYYGASQDEKSGKISAEEASKRKGGAIGGTGGSLAGGAAGAWTGSKIGGAIGGAIGGGIGLMFGGVGAVPGAAWGTLAGRAIGGVAGAYFGSSQGGDLGRQAGEALSGQPTASGQPTSDYKNPLSDQKEFDYEKYINLVGQNESNNNYGSDNQIGFLGRYQFGSSALETLGLLKPGSSARFGDRGSNAAVYHDEAWANGLSRDKFLSNPQLQDEIMKKYTAAHYSALEKAGVVKAGMKGDDLAARLYAAHHGGVGGATRFFRDGKDTGDFAFAGSSVGGSANKMLAQYSGNTPTTAPHTQVASGPASGLTASSLTSQNAMMASTLAEAQSSWNAMSKAMFGQEIKIDMSREINNILGDGAGQGGLAQLMTSNPNNPINKMAFAATGAGNPA